MKAPEKEVADTGARIREARKLRRLTLRELGEQVGATASFLSQLERGASGASLSTLVRISNALGMTLPQLFEGEMPAGIATRAGEHPELNLNEGAHSKKLLTRPTNRSMNAYLSSFEPGQSTGEAMYVHGSADELLYVISGVLTLELQEQVVEVSVGDTVEFRTDVPHRLSNRSSAAATALIVVSPPTSYDDD